MTGKVRWKYRVNKSGLRKKDAIDRAKLRYAVFEQSET